MSRPPTPDPRFDPAILAGLDEPVRRYLAHALAPGAPLTGGVRLTMRGRIRVGLWLAFTAEQEIADHAFTWRARAGLGRLRPLHVVDRYRDGAGSTDGRLFGRLRFLHADDPDTTRAAAARAAVESIWDPASLLPARGVAWRAESPTEIVAALDVPPERPEVRLAIDEHGAVRRVEVMRWRKVGQKDVGYIPFGGLVHAERRFGDLVLPSALIVGWWLGTPRFAPFFEATIVTAAPA